MMSMRSIFFRCSCIIMRPCAMQIFCLLPRRLYFVLSSVPSSIVFSTDSGSIFRYFVFLLQVLFCLIIHSVTDSFFGVAFKQNYCTAWKCIRAALLDEDKWCHLSWWRAWGRIFFRCSCTIMRPCVMQIFCLMPRRLLMTRQVRARSFLLPILFLVPWSFFYYGLFLWGGLFTKVLLSSFGR